MSRLSKDQNQIFKLLEKSTCPLSVSDIVKSPGLGLSRSEVSAALDFMIIEKGLVFRCTKHRYWDRDEADFLKQVAKELLKEKNLSKNAFARALTNKTGATQPLAKKVFDDLCREDGFYLHPNRRFVELSLTPFSVASFLEPLAKQINLAASQLGKIGVSKEEISVELGFKNPGRENSTRKVAPCDDANYETDVLRLIGFAWEDSREQIVQRELELLLIQLGATPIGAIGESPPYNGAQHLPETALRPGEKFQITRPGWFFPNSKRVLIKAKVRKL